MSDSSDNEEIPPHIARYREYKRKQELKKQKKAQSGRSATPTPAPPLDTSTSSALDTLINHPLTTPLLKLLLWVLLLLFFAHHEFGSVFFLVSIPILVWGSMEEYKRGPRELSAYSVFNRNCEQLDGTFTSEQWEKELRYGAAAVRKQQ